MLGRLSRCSILIALICGVLTPVALTQQTSKVTLDVSETLFSVVAAINTCGYDQELGVSDPVRLQVRAEITRESQTLPEARSVQQELCAFYRDHQSNDGARDLAQYVSLALTLGEPPSFTPTVKESDMPPDAAYVLGFVPVLQRFYIAANLHGIWLRHQKEYNSLIERNHEAIAKMLLGTDVYLKIPLSGYADRHFNVLIEPMAAPGQTNARNYGADYYIVLSLENGQLNMDQIRHTYLHFLLDPMAMRRGTSLRRIAPVLDEVKTAPLDESYKTDISLLLTESLIRAIEARQLPAKGKGADTMRERAANAAAEEGFILAPYFYDRLVQFEKEPVGLQNAYGDWLYLLDVNQERKRAANTQFRTKAAPEILRSSKPATSLLDEAEKKLAAGDFAEAKQLAQKALDSHQGDPGRVSFLLARAATLSKDMEGARTYFEKTLELSKEPRLLAWSHIYLGRIYDLKADRESALKHYRAALEAGDTNPTTKTAAERGLKDPYAPPAGRR